MRSRNFLRFCLFIFGSLIIFTHLSNADPLDNWHWRNLLPQGNPILAVIYENNIFTAVGYSGTILTSPDGISWTSRTSGTTEWLWGISYGNGTFVAVGWKGTILTSPDGVTWTFRTSGTTEWLRGISYGNGTFVAVGWKGTILTSPDGVTWTSRTSGTTNLLKGVTYGNGKFAVVGDRGTILTSSDGITWTSRISGTNNFLQGITYGNGVFVAVGDWFSIFTSPDGITWTYRMGSFAPLWLGGISYGNGTFVTVGNNGTILTSSDGINWVIRAPGVAVGDLQGVSYGNNTFVAVGDGGLLSSISTIVTSPDGVTWTSRTLVTTGGGNGISYGNNTFVSVGNLGKIHTSPDGVIWTSRTSGTTYDLNGISYGNGTFVTVGDSGTILTSPDGISWTSRTSGTNYNLYKISYGNGTFVAVGDSGKILTSPDGISWTSRTSGTTKWLDGITYGKGTFVAVGDSGTILTSTDGISWTSRTSGTTTNDILDEISYGNGNFVAVGYLHEINGGIILTSSDGVTWTRRATTPDSLDGITYGNSTFVVVGGGNAILTSPDGETWISRTSMDTYWLQGITYGNGTYVTVGMGNSILTSIDGINWVERNSGPGTLEGITYGNGTFVAVGDLGTILTSPDGVTWTLRTSGTYDELQGITYGNGMFVAVGGAGTIVTSSDGITWTSSTISKNFLDLDSLQGITYGNGMFVAVGSTTLWTSFDGVTWTSRTRPEIALYGISYGKGTFVAVGISDETNRILTSSDGINWMSITPGASPLLTGVTYGNGIFVAVGQLGTILTSSDGINWTSRASGTTTELQGIMYSNGTFFAVGELNTILQSDLVTPQAEAVSTPSTPSGPTSGTTGTSYTYTTAGSVSSLGHSVQYFFDWGDGTNSGWLPVGTTSASHSWTSVGTYLAKAQARCATDASVLSSWSSSISLNIVAPITYTLTASVNPAGAGTVTLNPPGGTYNAGTIVTLTATANAGYSFSSWSGLGTGDTSSGAVASIIMNSNKAITANFGPIPPQQYALTISVNPSGAGIVTLNPAGGTYNAGTVVTLTATANSGYTFSSWSGVDASSNTTGYVTMNGNRTVTANFSGSSSTAIRGLPNCYTPSATSTVTISVTPSGTTNGYAVEDIPPSGWTVSTINEGGLWDSVNKKVKWGPFFDHNPRTLTYQFTPLGSETGSKTFSGTASFDGARVAIGGESSIGKCVSTPHPADTNNDYRMAINEVTAYGAAWKTGQTWPIPPNPIPIQYVTNAGYLWKMGEVYHYDGSVNPPWVTGAASVQSITSHTLLQTPMASGTGSATRTLPGIYEPSVAVNVSILINPGQGTQVYAVEETPPNGWTVTDINESGQWDSVNKKVKWGLFFDSNNRTLTYKATPPPGESGAKTFSGTVSFDGNNVEIGGDQTILKGACTYSILPTSNTLGPDAGSGSVNVTTGTNCSWTASTNPQSWDWIRISSGWSGTGNGTVNYIVLPNTTGSTRSGYLTIAGQTFTITQQAQQGACTYSISPTSQSFGSGGGSNSINVTTGTNCPWTASTNSGSWDWIAITSGWSGTGSGPVNYLVLPNNTGSTRSGYLTIAGQTFTITQQGQQGTCSYSISPTSQSFGSGGGSNSINVTTGTNCPWTASTNSGSWDWIAITSGWSGTGSGPVNYIVLPNNTGNSRSGYLTIAGQTFTITQQAQQGVCTYSISPTSNSVGSGAGSGSVNVITSSGCSWTASTNSGSWDWIAITSGWSGTGSGPVNYLVLPNNTSSSRSGYLTIAGQTFTITQQAQQGVCTYSISPTSNSVGSGAGSGSVNVTAGTNCPWTASTNSGSWDWIGISAGWSGTGNGTVNYFVLANNTGSTRTGTLTIAGHTFTITQQGQQGTCSYSISPTSQSFGSSGGSNSINVTTGANCPWTASTNSGSWDWIGISAGWSGTGNGTVNYFVLANNTGSTRTGTLTIAGQTFTITQQGQQGTCSYSISPTSQSFGSGGGSNSINVTTGANCPWTASTNSGSWAWISITSGWSGTGSGPVNYMVLPNNTGSSRSGYLTIAGQTFTITQQTQQGACANIAGNWSGTATYWGDSLGIFFYLSQNGCNVSGTFQSPDSCPALCGLGAGGNMTGTVSGNTFTFTRSQDPLVDCETCELICYGTDHASLTIDGSRMYGIVESEDCETGMFDDVEVDLTRSDSVYSINNSQEKRGIGKSSLFSRRGYKK